MFNVLPVSDAITPGIKVCLFTTRGIVTPEPNAAVC